MIENTSFSPENKQDSSSVVRFDTLDQAADAGFVHLVNRLKNPDAHVNNVQGNETEAERLARQNGGEIAVVPHLGAEGQATGHFDFLARLAETETEPKKGAMRRALGRLARRS